MNPLSVISGIVGGVESGVNDVLGIGSYMYNQWAQRQQWKREDTAIQRRVRDLRAAGMNPVLAAGQGASSAAPIRLSPPNVEMGSSAIEKALNLEQIHTLLLRQKKEIAYTEQQTRLLRLQEEKLRLDNQFQSEMNPMKIVQQRMANELSEQTLSARINTLNALYTAGQLDNKIRELNVQLKQVGVTDAQVDLARNIIQQRIDVLKEKNASLDISQSEIEILAKQLAIDIRQYDFEMYQKIGLPTNVRLSDPLQVATVVGNTAADLIGIPQAVPGSGKVMEDYMSGKNDKK